MRKPAAMKKLRWSCFTRCRLSIVRVATRWSYSTCCDVCGALLLSWSFIAAASSSVVHTVHDVQLCLSVTATPGSGVAGLLPAQQGSLSPMGSPLPQYHGLKSSCVHERGKSLLAPLTGW